MDKFAKTGTSYTSLIHKLNAYSFLIDISIKSYKPKT